MTQNNIQLIKASQAKPLIETASRLGVPVKSLALQASMPFESVRKGEGVIGEYSLWRFIELASQYPGCEHLGYLTALDHPVTHTGQLGGMPITVASSLKDIFEIFFHEVVNESDSCDYQLVKQGGKWWFTRELFFNETVDGWQPELYVIAFIIQIVRLCAPGNWLPCKLRVATRRSPISVPPEWSSVDIDWGWSRTELLIEENILGCPPRNLDALQKSSTNMADIKQRQMLILDLVDRQIWSKQHGLNNAAQELGMSRATIKRRLASMNTSYSEILRERRLHHGVKLLESSCMSVKKIAEVMGYSAVSNFSRAFSKAKGTSPSAWREKIRDRVGS
ncbi:MAG: helix-turn-helix transcriptional regulator [Gammaproteobacteria bacterium]|nr:helix-turn-helix transcriptional regulator [Gammaproteobacteria bacterium]